MGQHSRSTANDLQQLAAPFKARGLRRRDKVDVQRLGAAGFLHLRPGPHSFRFAGARSDACTGDHTNSVGKQRQKIHNNNNNSGNNNNNNNTNVDNDDAPKEEQARSASWNLIFPSRSVERIFAFRAI